MTNEYEILDIAIKLRSLAGDELLSDYHIDGAIELFDVVRAKIHHHLHQDIQATLNEDF